MLRDWGGVCFFGDPSVSRPPFLVGDVERWGGGGESAFLGRVADCWLSGALDTVRGVDRVSCGGASLTTGRYLALFAVFLPILI